MSVAQMAVISGKRFPQFGEIFLGGDGELREVLPFPKIIL
jgi:hypothetical protein